MRFLVVRCRVVMARLVIPRFIMAHFIIAGALAGGAGATAAYAAPPQALPSHFAGEALTVALAFCFPALAAGAYLGLKRMNARLGGRSIAMLLLAVVVLGASAYLVEDANALLQRAGLASAAP